MRTPHRFLLLTFLLCCTGWSAMSFAYAPSQPPPQVSSRPVFLLIATQRIKDAWFHHSVVLTARHGRSGPIGLILNRPLNVPLDQAVPGYPVARDYKLFAGGPVYPPQLSFIYRSEQPATGTLRIADSVQMASDPALLGKLLDGEIAHSGLRVMKGLAAWGPGQLENEIARGDWYVLPVDESALFDIPAESLWEELYRRITSRP